MVIDYEKFCPNPVVTWQELQEKMDSQGYPMKDAYTGPERFDATTHVRVSPERWAAYERAYAAMQERDGNA
jgi:hypothetical protein